MNDSVTFSESYAAFIRSDKRIESAFILSGRTATGCLHTATESGRQRYATPVSGEGRPADTNWVAVSYLERSSRHRAGRAESDGRPSSSPDWRRVDLVESAEWMSDRSSPRLLTDRQTDRRTDSHA